MKRVRWLFTRYPLVEVAYVALCVGIIALAVTV